MSSTNGENGLQMEFPMVQKKKAMSITIDIKLISLLLSEIVKEIRI